MDNTSKPLTVLSIDFDYFQNVTADTIRECYPDGIDVSSKISAVVWASHYANREEGAKIKEVTCRTEELTLLRTILESCDSSIPVQIANSHVYIYDFIHDYAGKNTKLDITHIDMHHDVTKRNDEDCVDCRNWLGHITNEYDAKVDWVANPVSKEAYGSNTYDLPVTYSLADIPAKEYDMVFLCRSSAWLPPHLDDDFMELAVEIMQDFEDVEILQDLSQRDCQPWIEQMWEFEEEMTREKR